MNKGELCSGGNKLERKTVEKNRRLRMKHLCNKLVSIIRAHHFRPSKEFLSQQDQLEQATDYIKVLRERVEELRRRKSQLERNKAQYCTNSDHVNMHGSNLPILKIRVSGSSLEVALISGIQKKFKLNQVVSIIEEEGAEVAIVNLSNGGGKMIHSIHAKNKVPRVGIDTPMIGGRIQELF